MKKDFLKLKNKKLIKEIFTKKSIFISITVIVIFGLILFLLLIYWSNQKDINNLKEDKNKLTTNDNQEVTPKGVLPIAPGARSYSVRTDTPQNPQILKIDFDHLDVKIGEEQIITVKVEYKNTDTVTSKNKVFVTYYTDNGSNTIPLKLKKLDGPPLTALWRGTWKPNDSYNYIYRANILALSDAGESKVTLSFR